jgi:hypothetical protein
MAAGDVEIRIVALDTTLIDYALTAMRVTAGSNGKYGICNIPPRQVLIWAITEA